MSESSIPETAIAGDWSAAVCKRLQAADIRQIGVVPDTGQQRLIALCARERHWRMVTLTTEEEGVALAAGAWLGGQRSALLLQSSGVGNCFNMLGMALACRFPLLIVVTLRGEQGEFNPWMQPLGSAMQSMLERMGVACLRLDRAAAAATTIDTAAATAFDELRAVAVLLTQRLLGVRTIAA